jgi:hypothetical protein
MKTFKLILMLMGVAAFFASGYYLGSRQTGDLKSDLKKGREEMTQKAASLEKEIRSLRLRLNQYNAGRHLASAETALAERNYGVAQDELHQARKAISDARELSDPEKQKSVSRFEDKLGRIIEDSERPDSELTKRLNTLRLEWDQITE